MEGDVFEKGEFEPEGEDLAGQVASRGCGAVIAREIVAAGAEVGEQRVGVARELDAGGDQRAVELDDGTKLDFDAELDDGGGGGLAFEDPGAAMGEGRGEIWKQALAVDVAIGLEVERFRDEDHWVWRCPGGMSVLRQSVHRWNMGWE